MESCCQEKGSITDIASASALTKTSETSAGTASFAEGSAQGMAQVQYESDINADPSSKNTIRRTERNSQEDTPVALCRKKKRILTQQRPTTPHRAELTGGTEFSLIITHAVSCNSQEYDLLFYAVTMLRRRHQTNPLSPFALPAFSSKPDRAEGRPWRRGARGLPSRAGERRRCRRHPSKAQAPKQSSRTPLRE